MAGFDNDIMYADNVDFSGGSPVTGKVTTNGQLLIGSTATPNIKVGTLTSPNSTISIGYSSPNITLDLASGIAVAGPGSSTNRAIATWNGTGGSALFNNSSATIDSSGRMKNTSQPAFNVCLSGNISNVTGAGTIYQIPFDQVNLNQGNNFTSGASAHFTTPVSGFYIFNWTLSVTDLTVEMTDLLLQLSIGTQVQVLRINPFPNYVASNTSWSGSYGAILPISTQASLKLTISGGAGNTVDLIGTGIGCTFSGALIC